MVQNVQATTFDIMEVPTYVNDQLGCGEFIAGLLVSLVIFSLIMLPTIYLTKGKAYSIYIVMGMVILAPLVAFGWFPIYIYIIIIFLLAFGFSSKLRDFFGSVGR